MGAESVPQSRATTTYVVTPKAPSKKMGTMRTAHRVALRLLSLLRAIAASLQQQRSYKSGRLTLMATRNGWMTMMFGKASVVA